VRHPGRVQELFSDRAPLEAVEADVGDDIAVAAAVAEAWAVVNVVSLYVERGVRTFRSVHVEGAARVANAARQSGVARLVLVSGIGSDAHSQSNYIRSRGEGEAEVRDAFPDAVIVRPSVMFGPDDAFLSGLAGMLRMVPVFPLFGAGDTRLQPVHVEDVAEAIARVLVLPRPAPHYEFGGPRVVAYKALLKEIAAHVGRRRLLLPVPFAVWQLLAAGAGLLPNPPLTEGQVALMRRDNVATSGLPGFAALNITPRDIKTVLGGQA
jgi:NADH dehydrogenase